MFSNYRAYLAVVGQRQEAVEAVRAAREKGAATKIVPVRVAAAAA